VATVAEDPQRWEGDVVLADGGVVHVRPIHADDAEALVAFHHRQSPESLYYRYFSPKPRLTEAEVEHLVTVDYRDRMAFVALDGDLLIGVGRYDRLRTGNEAEVAFMVDEDHRGRGLATVFLEYLVAAARDAGIDELVAQVLPDNRRMLVVFERAGFTAHRQFADGVIEVELDLEETPAVEAAIADRERRAEARSVARLLAPAAVAVVAAEGPVGDPARTAVAQVEAGGFTGRVVRVGSTAAWPGAAAHPRIQDVPDAVDLALVAVAPDELRATVAACAAKGVRGLVLLTAADEVPGDPGDLVALVRRLGLRLVGPGALGVVNTDPAVGLVATTVPVTVAPGPIGFLSESGSLARAVLDRARRLGLGFSSVLAVGERADVSANDLLQYWEQDEATSVIALYLQSFGNPRKFSRIARRVSRSTPIVAVKSGRAPVAAGGDDWPDDMLDALLVQTGVIRVDTTEELLDVARLLAGQPVPAGRRVAVVADRRGPAVLASDACAGAGLELVATDVLGAGATAEDLGLATGRRLDEGADAVLVVRGGEPPAGAADEVAVAEAGAARSRPVVLVTVGRDAAPGPVPTFAFPEPAARALGRVAAHGAWRAEPPGVVVEPEHADREAAEALVAAVLADHPGGRTLTVAETDALLGCFGLAGPAQVEVHDADEAVAAAGRLRPPLALKALGLEHLGKVEAQGLGLDLHDGDEVRAAHERMSAVLGDLMQPALLQEMVAPGADVSVVLRQHARWGSTVGVGVGGAVAAALGDGATGIVPLTDLDAARLVAASPAGRLLDAVDGSSAQVAVEDVVRRVSALGDALPEVALLRLNPVIVGPDGAWVTSARAVVRPWVPGPDPGLRQL